MTRDEVKITLDGIYIYVEQIDEIEGRRRFFNGETKEVDELTKDSFYNMLRMLLTLTRNFLRENLEEPYVQETLKYMNEQEMKAAYGVSFGPAIIENSLEVAYAKYKPIDFVEYVEMVIYDPLLRILHHLYKNAVGQPFDMKYDLAFS